MFFSLVLFGIVRLMKSEIYLQLLYLVRFAAVCATVFVCIYLSILLFAVHFVRIFATFSHCRHAVTLSITLLIYGKNFLWKNDNVRPHSFVEYT